MAAKDTTPVGITIRKEVTEWNYGNLALAGFVMGTIITLGISYHIVMASRTLGWSSTVGVVVRSEVVYWRRVTPSIHYEYEVSGKKYQGKRIAYARGITEGSARRLVRKYPTGKRVTVYYDPEHPSSSVLERGGSPWINAFLAIGLAGLAVGRWAWRKAKELERSKTLQS